MIEFNLCVCTIPLITLTYPNTESQLGCCYVVAETKRRDENPVVAVFTENKNEDNPTMGQKQEHNPKRRSITTSHNL